MRKLLVLTLLAGLPLMASAAIYKFVDENGNTVYADQPGPNAEKIEKQDVQTIKTRKVSPTTSTKPNSNQNKKAPSYSEFSITKPLHNESLRANNGEIQINLQLSPSLQSGHKIVLLLDGKPVAEPSSNLNYSLHNVDRGQHSISANVINSKGKVVASAANVTVHVKRFSALFNGNKSESGINRAPMAQKAPMAPLAPQAN